jgi:catechol 2,3-dioxygenase-like lactoylglutathione lyase family enzyme
MIHVQTVHHVAVNVTDLERAERFYREVLGLEPVPRPHFAVAGTWYQLGDTQLHLIVYPPTHTLRGTTKVDIAEGHVALRVRSYAETVAHLKAHGVDMIDLPQNSTPWTQVYITDPDGNIIELNCDRA